MLSAMRRPVVAVPPRIIQKAAKMRISDFISQESEAPLGKAAEPHGAQEGQFVQPPTTGFAVRRLVNKDWLTPAPLWLRDACSCEMCVDPSSKQKLFKTSDIPVSVGYLTKNIRPGGTLDVTWSNDIPGFDTSHTSTFSKGFLASYRGRRADGFNPIRSKVQKLWNKARIRNSVKFIDFNHYYTHDEVLYDVLIQLSKNGLVFLRNVPESGKAIEDIAGRIGPLKNTFYGLTWDVKSIPNAKNVAYTHQQLGFHMDLLYMDKPPALQLLHCLKNSCEGGTSLFCDSYHAASQLREHNREAFDTLLHQKTSFTYDNAGECYFQERHVIGTDRDGNHINEVNWSPPFQAPFNIEGGVFDDGGAKKFKEYVVALKEFTRRIEAPNNIYEYRLNEGECVIFDNTRVLHARTAFDITSGERWLKGAYIDGDVWSSRQTTLDRKFRSVP